MKLAAGDLYSYNLFLLLFLFPHLNYFSNHGLSFSGAWAIVILWKSMVLAVPSTAPKAPIWEGSGLEAVVAVG